VVLEEGRRRACADDPALADRAARARALGADWGARLNALAEGLDAWSPGRPADEVAPLRRGLDAQRGAWAAAAAQAPADRAVGKGLRARGAGRSGLPPTRARPPRRPGRAGRDHRTVGPALPRPRAADGRGARGLRPGLRRAHGGLRLVPSPLLPGAALAAPPGGTL